MPTKEHAGGRGGAMISQRGVKRLPFFQGFSEPEVEELLDAGQLRHYRDGEEIRTEGGSRREIVILLRGQAKVWQHITRSETKILALVSPGQVIGFVSLFLEEPSSATVVSTGQSLGLAIGLETLEALAIRRPEVGLKVFGRLLRAAGERIRIMNDHLRAIGHLHTQYRPGSRECPVFKTCLLVPGKRLA